MDLRYLFPYELVERGSKIIIYGLGVCGTEYIAQIEMTNWCTIVGVCDKYAQDNQCHYPRISVDELKKGTEYDYIVLAIVKEGVWYTAFQSLAEMGIDKSKIISRLNIENSNLSLKRDKKKSHEMTEQDKKVDDPLEILFVMRGGIGDGVMETALYEELVRMSPDVVIDVFGEPYFKYIYAAKKHVRHIINYHEEKTWNKNYDLVIEGSWGISVSHYNLERIFRKSPELYETVMKTIESMKFNALVNRVQIARIKKKDKFWLMGREGVWNISSKNIHVEFDEEYESTFNSLKLKKYITFNCGADMRRITENDEFPTKVWPAEYFEQLLILIKNSYPEYELIQLGTKDIKKIPNADRHILGKNMELVKYILRGSSLHIDDEGGLVHLATAFGTKCLVLFGPTPSDLLGYPQNINVCTNVCMGCFPLGKWNAKCLLGMKKPKCMYSLTPELVMEYVSGYLVSLNGLETKNE